MEKHDSGQEKTVVPADRVYADFEPMGGPPLAADGSPDLQALQASIGPPPKIPSFEESKCRQGPCRHYWHMRTMAPGGNPEGTFEDLGIPEPRQHHHVCTANPGMETDLGDDFVFICNRWEPKHSFIRRVWPFGAVAVAVFIAVIVAVVGN